MPTRPITLGWGGRLDITRTSRSNCTPDRGVAAGRSLQRGDTQRQAAGTGNRPSLQAFFPDEKSPCSWGPADCRLLSMCPVADRHTQLVGISEGAATARWCAAEPTVEPECRMSGRAGAGCVRSCQAHLLGHLRQVVGASSQHLDGHLLAKVSAVEYLRQQQQRSCWHEKLCQCSSALGHCSSTMRASTLIVNRTSPQVIMLLWSSETLANSAACSLVGGLLSNKTACI